MHDVFDNVSTEYRFNVYYPLQPFLVEYLGLLNGEFQRLRERILHEWYQRLVSQSKAGDNIQMKFGRILNYYLETNVSTSEALISLSFQNFTSDFARTLTLLALNNGRTDVKQIYDVDACMKILNNIPASG